MPTDFPPELLAAIERITARRPRTVLQHILERGSITTDELKSIYGYDHPPRAARDVREHGIPLLTRRVPNPTGKSIGSYEIDVETFQSRLSGTGRGRRPIPRTIKSVLVARSAIRCEACTATFESDRHLQVDHRVPFEIAGDPSFDNPDEFMLLCPPCNREKSWTCEHCPNWSTRSQETCRTCYWADPQNYLHLATVQLRRVQVAFQGPAEVEGIYSRLRGEAETAGMSIQDLIKQKLTKT